MKNYKKAFEELCKITFFILNKKIFSYLEDEFFGLETIDGLSKETKILIEEIMENDSIK